MTTPTALDPIRRSDRPTIGLELPQDNDLSAPGRERRLAEGRRPGVPDLSRMRERVRAADDPGFTAIWVRDVPVLDAVKMGDA